MRGHLRVLRLLLPGLLAGMTGSGCVPIDGGSVEIAWVVRTPDGRAISSCGCSDPRIAFVRVKLARVLPDGGPGEDPCAGRSECGFRCERGTGASPFDIPPGLYEISVTATDATGQDLTEPGSGRGTVGVPAPILRDITEGQPTQLGAFLLQAECSAGCTKNTQICSN